MKRNIMRAFRIDEISGVDVPAQTPAVAAIMKRQTIKEGGMTPEEIAQMQEEMQRLTSANEQLTADNQRIGQINALSTEERAHFDALPDDMRSTFLGKSADERRAEIVAKNDADPVLYTTTDGIEFRKSSGDAVIAMAKRADAAHKAMQKMTEEREQEVLEKRADVELSHLPGDVQSRAALLKAVDSIPDEEQRKTAMAALKSRNDSAASAFQTLGHGGGLGEPSSEEDSLDKMAKSIQDKEGITFEQAYVKAMETPEGRGLYQKSLNGAAK